MRRLFRFALCLMLYYASHNALNITPVTIGIESASD